MSKPDKTSDQAEEPPRARRKPKPKQVVTENEIQTELAKVRETIRHKMNVLDACILLGERLIEGGEIDLGRQLIANGYDHDISKFAGIEHDFLSKYDGEDKSNIKLAAEHHNRTNKHHPEFWDPKDGIKRMPRLYLAELVCDWKARSGEMGLGLVDWIEGDAKRRFNFTKRDAVYIEIMGFVNLLLNKTFEPLPTDERGGE